MAKKDDENFETSMKCWICDNTFLEGNFTVKDHCQVTGKYRSAVVGVTVYHRQSKLKNSNRVSQSKKL